MGYSPVVMVGPVILSVVAFIAGHPTQVACDADVNPSPFAVASGYTVAAWTLTGGTTIHALPTVCDTTRAAVGTTAFAEGLRVFMHEAARARGLTGDSCPQMIADIGIYDVLRKFYGVPFFTKRSWEIGAQVLALTRTLPASYQPEVCWRNG